MGVLDDPGYLADLQAIVSHIGSKPGVYVLVSWADPTFTPPQNLNKTPDPTKPEGGWPTSVPNAPGLHSTQDVWEKLASTFAMEPHVLLGVCNEQERNSGTGQRSRLRLNRVNSLKVEDWLDQPRAGGIAIDDIVGAKGLGDQRIGGNCIEVGLLDEIGRKNLMPEPSR